jgi:hypothetical protein
MRRVFIVDYGKQSEKLNSKYYPLIWVAFAVATIFANLYSIYSGYIAENMERSAIVTKVLMDVVINGVLPVAICYLITSVFYRSLVKRGLFTIPRKDFIYFTLIFLTGARFLTGLVRVFGFLDDSVFMYSILYTDVIFTTIALYLEFFLVLAPKYLNPTESHAHFKVLSKLYTIWIAVIATIVFFVVILMVEALKIIIEEGGDTTVIGGFITVTTEGLTPEQLKEELILFEGPFLVASSTNFAFALALVITHFVTAFVLKKKGDEYRKANPEKFVNENKGRYTSFFANDSYGNPFANNGANPNGNPFVNPNGNPFANHEETSKVNPFGDDFGATDNPFGEGNSTDNPFGEDNSTPFGDDNSKDDNPFDEF